MRKVNIWKDNAIDGKKEILILEKQDSENIYNELNRWFKDGKIQLDKISKYILLENHYVKIRKDDNRYIIVFVKKHEGKENIILHAEYFQNIGNPEDSLFPYFLINGKNIKIDNLNDEDKKAYFNELNEIMKKLCYFLFEGICSNNKNLDKTEDLDRYFYSYKTLFPKEDKLYMDELYLLKLDQLCDSIINNRVDLGKFFGYTYLKGYSLILGINNYQILKNNIPIISGIFYKDVDAMIDDLIQDNHCAYMFKYPCLVTIEEGKELGRILKKNRFNLINALINISDLVGFYFLQK